MSRAAWACVRVLGGAAILAVLVWRLGTGPSPGRTPDDRGWSLAAAAGIAFVTTVCSAWRWSLVARGLGVACRCGPRSRRTTGRSSSTRPCRAGSSGDVHRGVRHGRDAGDVGRGLRAVGWERVAGQAVQVVLALIVLLVLPSPVRPSMPAVLVVAVLGVLGAVVLVRALPRRGHLAWARALRTARADVRAGLLARRARAAIVLASVVVVAGHAATFLIAARTAGSTASRAATAAAGDARAAGDERADEHRRMGPARRRGGVGCSPPPVSAPPGLGVAAGVRRTWCSPPACPARRCSRHVARLRQSRRHACRRLAIGGTRGKADVPHQPVPVAA